MDTQSDTRTRAQRKDHVRAEKVAVCKLRREASVHSKPSNTLISDFQPPDCEKINVCCSSLHLWYRHGSPSTLIQKDTSLLWDSRHKMYYPEFNHENHTENANLGTLQSNLQLLFKSVMVTKRKTNKLSLIKVQRHNNLMQYCIS